jgi:hypothetical protein
VEIAVAVGVHRIIDRVKIGVIPKFIEEVSDDGLVSSDIMIRGFESGTDISVHQKGNSL